MRELVICCFVAALMATPLSAQLRTWVADVPFPFWVGDNQLPAGQYLFHPQSGFGKNVLVEAKETRKSIIVLSSPGATARRDAKTPVISFRKYDEDRIFLATITDPWSTGITIVKGNREREVITSTIRAGIKPATILVAAR